MADAVNHLLVPSVGRNPSVYSSFKEQTIFRNFRRRALPFLDAAGLDDWDLLAIGQHHRLPTRLLDWTTNPLVAAYFAVTSSPRTTTARIYAATSPPLVDRTLYPDPMNCPSVVAFVPAAASPRIVTQRGLFTVHPSPTQPWRPGSARSGTASTFDIDPQYRLYFERKLFQLAIEASSIKADLDGIAETLAWQFENDVAVGAFNY